MQSHIGNFTKILLILKTQCLFQLAATYIKKLKKITLTTSDKIRKNGYGSLLTHFNNKVIESKKKPSFLVCDNKEIKFYKKNNWKSLKKINFRVMDENYGPKNGMIYNFSSKNKIYFWVKK